MGDLCTLFRKYSASVLCSWGGMQNWCMVLVIRPDKRSLLSLCLLSDQSGWLSVCSIYCARYPPPPPPPPHMQYKSQVQMLVIRGMHNYGCSIRMHGSIIIVPVQLIIMAMIVIHCR